MTTRSHRLGFRRPRRWWGLSAFRRLLVRVIAIVCLAFAFQYNLSSVVYSRVINPGVPFYRRVVDLGDYTVPLETAISSLDADSSAPVLDQFVHFFLERVQSDIVLWVVILAGVTAILYEIFHKTDVLESVRGW